MVRAPLGALQVPSAVRLDTLCKCNRDIQCVTHCANAMYFNNKALPCSLEHVSKFSATMSKGIKA